jgi:DNA-binding GntR family transcriptional regulator
MVAKVKQPAVRRPTNESVVNSKKRVVARVKSKASKSLAPIHAQVSADTEIHNLTDQAYTVVRRMILERELTGGEVLVEGRLATRLDMSRTPLREALLRLEGEGLLVRANARSYAVRRITAAHYFQCLQVRERLESQAVSLAIGRIAPAEIQQLRDSILGLDSSQQGSSHWQADDQIHGIFARASGNEMLAETIAHLRVLCRLFEVVDPFKRIEDDRIEHLAILDAYTAGDGVLAEQAVTGHLRNLGRYTLSRLSNGLVSDFSSL